MAVGGATNADAVQPGQPFHPSNQSTNNNPPSTHQIGTANDGIQTNAVKVLPAGTSANDPEHTFQPNPNATETGTIPRGAEDTDRPTSTSALDTFPDTTSKDLTSGLGQPVQGQSSRELHTAKNRPTNKKEGTGLAGVGRGEAARNVQEVVGPNQDAHHNSANKLHSI
ncbi:hypothetical protein SAICODRAFT_23751 [Saitoella complicata NRRL Y-17804]|uniref:uncharacterized protein n=1 Tax=Saitoella complicata (strain BCRC 22490 / CBS 7301 / JCM 7358 / NBRC 10748 / NRRL Y-17804) TaxID=698492 RepID=UPI00086685DE|nr:uncharacterized protein SAICODRAFT_23751 [Saitoella complicata NRRL Y-17804]ODQ55073.1 hypothetical protein SAICODRAFT_23751 [Saitoella complicata NRRL Y-17804]